jgi:uncharacterized protein (TIGR03066 family)
MRTLGFALVAAVLLGLAACSGKNAGEGGGGDRLSAGQYKEAIVGKWEGTAGDYEGVPVEVGGDGKLSMTMEEGGQTVAMDGTYQLEGKTLKVSVKNRKTGEEENYTFTIKSLTPHELVVEHDEGKTSTFARQ